MHTWADDFNTYDDACRYYGAETSAEAKADADYWAAIECVEWQDEMEARGGPVYSFYDSTIPF